MPRQLWLADIIADEWRGVKGFRVEVWPHWQSLGSHIFDPIGVMNHHTGPGAYDNLLRYMLVNSPTRPNCNWATSQPQGGIVRITVCCGGRANHAGVGNLPWTGANGGNRHTIGGEHQNTGQPTDVWDNQQLEAIHRTSAALLRHLKQNESRAVEHKTYTTRKIDRHTITVQTAQREIARYLRPPEPKQPEEDEEMNVICQRKDGSRWHITGGIRIRMDDQAMIDAATRSGARDIGEVPDVWVNTFPWPRPGYRPPDLPK